LEGGVTARGGVAFHYPKQAELSFLAFMGGQTLGRTYGTQENRTTRSFSGPLFGTGVSWGYEFTLDPVVVVSPVFNHADGKHHLLWGGGIHVTMLGIIGLNLGCEGLKSAFMCGGGLGLAISEHNHPFSL
jgi:hypothetical protein